ncbi:Programmed cell death protein 4 [Goodea atripinnis]|uniref:Programmed cell death protein 4 n=1 Tax=Goodea atripinnis TaxID=208336 RepID=A0ABV0N7Q3_9TELE
MRSEVPSLAVSLALEAKTSQRELTSRLLVDLCGSVLSHSDMESSFDKLLRDLPDLVLDTPGAPQDFPSSQILTDFITLLILQSGARSSIVLLLSAC